MRDIAFSSPGFRLPDVGEDFPTHALLVRLTVGQQALAGRDDRHAQATEDLGQAGALRVHAQTGLADPADTGDRALTATAVLELDGQGLADGGLALVVEVVGDLPGGDVTLLEQDLRDASLQLAVRHGDRVVVRLVGVAQTRQHVCDRVSHCHGVCSLSKWFRVVRRPRDLLRIWGCYQLDLVTPGSSPR